MKQTFNHKEKEIIYRRDKDDEDLDLGCVAEYVTDGYKIRIFDAKGVEQRNSQEMCITSCGNSEQTPILDDWKK